jgi:hypothetical protein
MEISDKMGEKYNVGRTTWIPPFVVVVCSLFYIKQMANDDKKRKKSILYYCFVYNFLCFLACFGIYTVRHLKEETHVSIHQKQKHFMTMVSLVQGTV